MHIEELTRKTGNKNVTVSLSYDEVKDISNGLYYLTQMPEYEKKYAEIYSKCKFLFDMVKHGNIQQETITRLFDLKGGDNSG